MEKPDPLERSSSVNASLHSQCKLKSLQKIRALQTDLEMRKKSAGTYSAHSPSGSIEKIQPNTPSTALKLIYWGEKPSKTNSVQAMAAPVPAQAAFTPLSCSRSSGAEPYLPRCARASKCSPWGPPEAEQVPPSRAGPQSRAGPPKQNRSPLKLRLPRAGRLIPGLTSQW